MNNKGFVDLAMGMFWGIAAATTCLLAAAGLGVIPLKNDTSTALLKQGQKQVMAATIKKNGHVSLEDGWFLVNSKAIGHDINAEQCKQIVLKEDYGKKFIVVQGLSKQAEAEKIVRKKSDCKGKLTLLVRLN